MLLTKIVTFWIWFYVAGRVTSAMNNRCEWRNLDILFVTDSTNHVGAANHLLLLKFLNSLLSRARISQSKLSVGLAQFTPEARFELGLERVSSRLESNILRVPYIPCQREECQTNFGSLNSIVSTAMSVKSGNRVLAPDVIIVVSTSLYQIPELSPNELLIKPVSVTHAFLVTVGNGAPILSTTKRLQFAATTAHFAAIDFRSLPELVAPLCASVASFVVSPKSWPADLSWWHYLKWDVSTCTHLNQANTVFWTLPCETAVETSKHSIPLIIFILVVVLIVITAALLLLFCGCVIYKYRMDIDELRLQVLKERDGFIKLDEYYRVKLKEKSANEKEREKVMLELINDSNKVRDQYQEHVKQHEQELQTARDLTEELKQRRLSKQNPVAAVSAPQLQPQIVPIYLSAHQPGYPSFLAPNPGEIPSPSAGIKQQLHGGGRSNRIEKLPLTTRQRSRSNSDSDFDDNFNDNNGKKRRKNKHYHGNTDENKQKGNDDKSKKPPNVPPLPSSASELTSSGLEDVKNDDDFNFERTFDQLPPDHPARILPPVDVLLLVDASGSIGNVLFENVKQFLIDFIYDIDISPGRSRLCVTLFAQEPSVFFGFDQFYSNHAVARAIYRIPYIGGPTYLAKALSFAAGIFYQNQNMKKGQKKHKTMPTPRHDRLQVMIVLSDGASDDNFDNQATHLHEKLFVKIGAVITRSFNRDKLLPITRYDGSIFTLDQQQALSIWLWKQQRIWSENFTDYVKREKLFTNLLESTRTAREHPEQPVESVTDPLSKTVRTRKK